MATLKELAELVHGTIIGDPNLLIKGTSTIDDGKPDTITFIGYKNIINMRLSVKLPR